MLIMSQLRYCSCGSDDTAVLVKLAALIQLATHLTNICDVVAIYENNGALLTVLLVSSEMLC